MKTKFYILFAPFVLISEMKAQTNFSDCLLATRRCSSSESVSKVECENLLDVFVDCINGECKAGKEEECNIFMEEHNTIAAEKGCISGDFINDCAVLTDDNNCSTQRDLCLLGINSKETCDLAVFNAIDCSYSTCRDEVNFCQDFSSSIKSIFEENSKECEISITQCEEFLAGDDVSPNVPDEMTCIINLFEAFESAARLPCDEILSAFTQSIGDSCDADDGKQCSGFVSFLNAIFNFKECGEELLVEDCSLIQNDDNNAATSDCASTMDFCADYLFFFNDSPNDCFEIEDTMSLCLGKACEQQSGVCSAFPAVIEFRGSLQEFDCSITDEKCLEEFGNPPVNDCDDAIATCMKELEDVPCSDVSTEVGKCASDACNADNDDHCTSLRLHLNSVLGAKGCFNAHVTKDDCVELFDGAVRASSWIYFSLISGAVVAFLGE